MKKRVVLTLMGICEEGMNAKLRILEKSGVVEREIHGTSGQLPPAQDILKLLQQWQLSYRQINAPSRIKFKNAQIIQSSCQEISTQLTIELNKWLNCDWKNWKRVRDCLLQNLSKTDEIIVSIETEDLRLQQLPWSSWDLFRDYYRQAEVALSVPIYQALKVVSSPANKVKLLAIIGNSEGIDVTVDRITLEKLPNAEVRFLVEPERKELNNELWSQGWDILFFAGHSSSRVDGTGGLIYINQTQSLTITDLRYALVKAIENGLKVAIFNSCDGLGIARDLADLNIPQMIVMRESVPDRVAQEFLKNFLSAYANGKSFYLAVRQAREKLQGLENEFPCASWLPTIFQNPTQMPLDWQELQIGKNQHPNIRQSWSTVLLISALVTSLIMGVRYLGWFQASELQAFDLLLRSRPEEQRDERLLIVTVTESDLQLPQQRQKKGSLSDLALNQALQKLEQHKPLVIGLDIYRDFPVDIAFKDLAHRLRQNHNLIGVCKISDVTVNDPGVAPPPEVSLERLGFSDFLTDPDDVLRRQLLITGSDPTSPCTTPYAFSIQLAFRYLVAKGILPKFTSEGVLQLGNKLIKPLESHRGGYQAIDVLPYQLLLNYRYKEVAATATLEQLLNNKVKPDAIKDRIILIGTTANSFQDDWRSPYSSNPGGVQRLPGVVMQAQMTSQILSAVLDGRPLLWAYPFWGDVILVFGCSIVGGVLTFAWLVVRGVLPIQLRSPILLGVPIATGEVFLYGLSLWLLMYSGCWIPLIPSALALPITSVIVAAYENFKLCGSKYKFVGNE